MIHFTTTRNYESFMSWDFLYAVASFISVLYVVMFWSSSKLVCYGICSLSFQWYIVSSKCMPWTHVRNMPICQCYQLMISPLQYTCPHGSGSLSIFVKNIFLVSGLPSEHVLLKTSRRTIKYEPCKGGGTALNI